MRNVLFLCLFRYHELQVTAGVQDECLGGAAAGVLEVAWFAVGSTVVECFAGVAVEVDHAVER